MPETRLCGEAKRSAPEAILIAQEDGNLVIVAPGNRPIWETGVQQTNTVYQLQDDQNFVGYGPGHQALWESVTR